jgi:hypothetical protein
MGGRRPRRLPERVVQLREQLLLIDDPAQADRTPRCIRNKGGATAAGTHIQVIGM